MTMTPSTEYSDPDRPQGLDPEKLLAMGQTPAGEVIHTGAGRAFAPPSVQEISAAFPDLEVQGMLGAGGMGAVYRAIQPRLGREVAIKILPPELFRDPSFAERFTREAQTLAKLNHPNIVTVHDFGEQGGFHFLLMECIDGINLRQMLDMEKLSPVEALGIVPQICEALQYAHDHGIVHRDIKPENILMDQAGKVHIADFGLAKILNQKSEPLGLTQSHQVLGTPHYMAPEQIEQPSQVDHRADIFSLGVVFYEMLTGKLPLGRFEPPSKRGGVNPEMDDVIMRTLEREPNLRYQAARDVQQQVERMRSTPPSASAATGAEKSGGPASAAANSTFVPAPKLSLRALFGFLWLAIGGGIGGVGLLGWLLVARAPATFVDSGSVMLESTAEPTPNSLSIMPFAFILVFLAILMGGPILAATAITQIRNSRGRIYGMGLAVFTAFILPILVVDVLACLPFSLIESESARAIALPLFILALLSLNIWFLMTLTQRLSRPPVAKRAAAR